MDLGIRTAVVLLLFDLETESSLKTGASKNCYIEQPYSHDIKKASAAFKVKTKSTLIYSDLYNMIVLIKSPLCIGKLQAAHM